MDGDHPQGQEGPDRRTALAADRTVFAAERTYAAWVRTGLAVLVLLSAFSFIAGVWRQVLHPGSLPPEGDTKRIYPPVVIAVNAALVVVAMSALIGIWAGRPGLG